MLQRQSSGDGIQRRLQGRLRSQERQSVIDRRLQSHTGFFRAYARWSLWLLAWMSCQRAGVWFLLPPLAHPPSFGEWAQAFFMGLRFDLLVLGFFAIPLVLTCSFDARPLLVRGYLAMVTGMIFVAGLFGTLTFPVLGRYWTMYDGSSLAPPPRLSWFLLVILVVPAGWVFRQLREMELSSGAVQSEGWLARGLRILGPLLLVGLAARGTVTPHHLELQHTFISQETAVHRWILNPVWSFDKRLFP